LKLEVDSISVKTTHAFKISRSVRRSFELFIFNLTHEGIAGLGEAAPQKYYGESPDTVKEAVHALRGKLDGTPDELIPSLSDEGGELHELLAAHPSVRAALDIALWDIKGKIEDRPCYEFFGANPSNTPLTSFTIGFDVPEVIDAKVDAAEKYKILKVKVGLPGDIELLDRVILRNEQGYGLGYFGAVILAQLVLGILASIIVMWVSRQREYRADAGSARLNGREPMIRALARLERGQPSQLPESMEAFGIAGGKRSMMHWFMSHPPIADRIAALQKA